MILKKENMKKNIIITITLVLLFTFAIFISYRVGFKYGYNYTFSIQDQEDINNILWTSNAKGKTFGKFYVLQPRDIKINSLWITPINKPYTPVISIEESGKDITIADKKGNSILIGFNMKDKKLDFLAYFSNAGKIFDFNLNGTWDMYIKKQKNGYSKALQINNVWYEYTNKKNEVIGKKDSLFINTQDGKKEVLRDNGDYYIKSERIGPLDDNCQEGNYNK